MLLLLFLHVVVAVFGDGDIAILILVDFVFGYYCGKLLRDAN